MKTGPIKVKDNSKINFLVKKNEDILENVFIKITNNDDKIIFKKDEFHGEEYEFIEVEIEFTTELIIEVQDIYQQLSLEYFIIYDNSAYENGITYLNVLNDKIDVINKDNIQNYYADNCYRNQFHFSPFKGWINDPNGLIHYKGYYHMFYQYYPHAPIWGNMHWGHTVSKDLIHWKHLPIALMPGNKLDNEHMGGAFSGNAIEYDNKMYLFYTDHFENKKDNSIFIEKQEIATSNDGITFELHPANPVISEKPANSSKDFRDPKVFKDTDGLWKMILGGAYENLPGVLIYSSNDLISWQFEGPLYQERKISGRAIECPDFFEYGDKHVLLLSVFQEEENEKNYFTRYIVGNYSNNRFTAEYTGIMDFGPDFYATQTFLDDKDRRIGIAWIENWTSLIKSQNYGFSGAMSLPREFYLNKNCKLRSKPVEETKLLRIDQKPIVNKNNLKIDNSAKILSLSSNCFELYTEVALEKDEIFNLKLRSSIYNNNCIEIVYDEQKNKLSVINKEEDETKEYSTKLNEFENKLELHIFADRSCVEIFVNNYEISGTIRMYLNQSNNDIIINTSKSSKIETFKIWELKSLW